MQNTKVLDCTLRDGGYYNDWNFSLQLAQTYLNGINNSGVTHVELGLRTPATDNFYGPFAYCSESFLQTLPLDKSIEYGVMINAKEYLDGEVADIKTTTRMFCSREKSECSFVRIACHTHEIENIKPVAKCLHDLGYQVIVNIMQIAIKSDEEIETSLNCLNKWSFLEAIYFADSLGSMSPLDIESLISKIRLNWQGPLGIHAHNNKNQALNNTLFAYENNVEWLDCTVMGMGRGAGNCCSEYLLTELAKKEAGRFRPEALFGLILGELGKLKQKYSWGPNLLYYISGDWGIHPTYIQKILNQDNIDADQLILAIERLKEIDSTAFQSSTYSNILAPETFSSEGEWAPMKEMAGRDVLILGSGPQLAEHAHAVEAYIKKHKPIVLNLNVNSILSHEYIDYYVACNPTRIVTNFVEYNKLEKPLIAPEKAIQQIDAAQSKTLNILNFGLKVLDQDEEVHETFCVLRDPLVYPYALSLCSAGKAKQVLLAGFDGYPEHDYRFDLMRKINKEFVPKLDLSVKCITPSNFKLERQSIYSMI